MTSTQALLNTIAPPDTLTRTTQASARHTHSEATCVALTTFAIVAANEGLSE